MAANVRQLQQMLQARGLYQGRIDGIAGPQTQAALAAYNRQSRAAPPIPRERPGSLAGDTTTGVGDLGSSATGMMTLPPDVTGTFDAGMAGAPPTSAAIRANIQPPAQGTTDPRWTAFMDSLGGKGISSGRPPGPDRFAQASDPVTSDTGVPDRLINALNARTADNWRFTGPQSSAARENSGILDIPIATGSTPATLDESTQSPPNPMTSMANMLAGAVQGADPGMLSRTINKLMPGAGTQFGTMSTPGLPNSADKSGQMPQPPMPGPAPRAGGVPPLATLQQLMSLQRTR